MKMVKKENEEQDTMINTNYRVVRCSCFSVVSSPLTPNPFRTLIKNDEIRAFFYFSYKVLIWVLIWTIWPRIYTFYNLKKLKIFNKFKIKIYLIGVKFY